MIVSGSGFQTFFFFFLGVLIEATGVIRFSFMDTF